LEFYLKNLKPLFHIQYYDSCDLAGIDKSDDQESIIHQQFINRVIDRAVKQLLKNEGDNYLYMPKDDWFEKMNLKAKIIKNGEHEMYTDKNVVNMTCSELIKEINVS